MQVAAPFQLEPKRGRQHVIERMQHLNDVQRPYQRICIFMTMFFFRKDSVNLNPASTQYHTPRVTIRPCHRARRFPMQSASFENATRAVHKNLFKVQVCIAFFLSGFRTGRQVPGVDCQKAQHGFPKPTLSPALYFTHHMISIYRVVPEVAATCSRSYPKLKQTRIHGPKFHSRNGRSMWLDANTCLVVKGAGWICKDLQDRPQSMFPTYYSSSPSCTPAIHSNPPESHKILF